MDVLTSAGFGLGQISPLSATGAAVRASVLTTVAGMGTDAEILAEEIDGNAPQPSRFIAQRVSTGVLHIFMKLEAVPLPWSDPLVVGLGAAHGRSLLCGVATQAIPQWQSEVGQPWQVVQG